MPILVVMLIYLDHAIRARRNIAGLVPLFIGAGTGSEVMQRIAAQMIGGMITASLLSMVVLPAAYLLLRARRLPASAGH